MMCLDTSPKFTQTSTRFARLSFLERQGPNNIPSLSSTSSLTNCRLSRYCWGMMECFRPSKVCNSICITSGRHDYGLEERRDDWCERFKSRKHLSFPYLFSLPQLTWNSPFSIQVSFPNCICFHLFEQIKQDFFITIPEFNMIEFRVFPLSLFVLKNLLPLSFSPFLLFCWIETNQMANHNTYLAFLLWPELFWGWNDSLFCRVCCFPFSIQPFHFCPTRRLKVLSWNVTTDLKEVQRLGGTDRTFCCGRCWTHCFLKMVTLFLRMILVVMSCLYSSWGGMVTSEWRHRQGTGTRDTGRVTERRICG